MTIHIRRPQLRIAFVAVLLLVTGLSGISTGTGGDRPVFSGQATAVMASVLNLEPITLADTGYFESPEFLPPAPCTEEGISIPNVSVGAEILCASTRGKGDHSMSNAHVAALDANVAGIPVTATLLRSNAKAGCNVLTPVLNGQAHVLEAQVGPVKIDADPLVPTPRNEKVFIPGGSGAYFIIAEQETSANGNRGDITLTALRVVVPELVPGTGDTDVSFARAHADVICQGNPVCPGPHFVTGGGFLNDEHGKKHFVIAFREGDTGWGHLMYSDKDSSAKLRAAKPFTSAKVYPEGKEGGGTLIGTTTAGNAFKAHITDNGEPGREDVFDLFSPDGVTLATGNLDGGNIQVHKACRTQ
jgi:hypothetical protein